MIIDELNIWEKTKDYQQGIALLKRIGSASDTVLTWLCKSQNSATEKTLQRLLHQYSESLPTNPTPTQTKAQKIEAIKAQHQAKKQNQSQSKATKKELEGSLKAVFAEDRPEAPLAVKELVAQRKRLYKHRLELKAVLNQTVIYAEKYTNAERAKIATQLTNTHVALERIWKQIIHYRTYNELPTAKVGKKEKEQNRNLYQTRQNLRSRISKIKKGILRNTDLKANLEELERIEALIALGKTEE